jgi:hypothetical protein
MTLAELQTFASALESFTTVAAIIGGGWWAYWKFVIQRGNEPATDIEVDVAFIGAQDDKLVVQITSTLNNKSLVRLQYDDFQVSARYLLPDDAVREGGERLAFQLLFPRTIDERIDGAKRYFSNVNYINPKQEFRHRYITYIPVDATFLWVQCKFFFRLKRRIEKTNTQKIFPVPRLASVGSAARAIL